MTDKIFVSQIINSASFISTVNNNITFNSVLNNLTIFSSTISSDFANLNTPIARGHEYIIGFISPTINMTPTIYYTEHLIGVINQSGVQIVNNYPMANNIDKFGGSVKYKLTIKAPYHSIIGTEFISGSTIISNSMKSAKAHGTIIDSGSVTGQLQHYELLSDYDALYLNDMDSFNLSDLDLVIV